MRLWGDGQVTLHLGSLVPVLLRCETGAAQGYRPSPKRPSTPCNDCDPTPDVSDCLVFMQIPSLAPFPSVSGVWDKNLQRGDSAESSF